MAEWKLAERYGPWAVVTGASDGMGREIAKRLAGGGLNLILVARRAPVLESLAAELMARHGIEVRTLALDLGRRADVERLVAGTQDTDVGLLVAAAGFGTSGQLVDADLEQELDLLAVNCTCRWALNSP